MILKDGDKVTIDGTNMEVNHSLPHGYWFKEIGTSASYIHLYWKSTQEIEELYKNGRLRMGTVTKVVEGDKVCSWHSWKKYVGIREIYDYCSNCGSKIFKDWTAIKDDKEY